MTFSPAQYNDHIWDVRTKLLLEGIPLKHLVPITTKLSLSATTWSIMADVLRKAASIPNITRTELLAMQEFSAMAALAHSGAPGKDWSHPTTPEELDELGGPPHSHHEQEAERTSPNEGEPGL